MTQTQIKFWTTKGKWGCFSNFSKHSILIGNTEYPTSEHLYQALKCIRSDDIQKILKTDNPKIAKTIAHSIPIRKDWNDIKINAMHRVLKLKFDQHIDVRHALYDSIGCEIIEASPYDSFWGWGLHENGENHLGKLWMEIRSEKFSD